MGITYKFPKKRRERNKVDTHCMTKKPTRVSAMNDADSCIAVARELLLD